MILDYINIFLDSLGFGFDILTFSELSNVFNSVTWDTFARLLSVDVLSSWVYYLSWFYGIWSVICVLPYRLFKKVVRFPRKKEVK